MKNLNGKLGWGVGEDSSNCTATSTNSVTNRKLVFFGFPAMPSADLPAYTASLQSKCQNGVKNHLNFISSIQKHFHFQFKLAFSGNFQQFLN